jgi:hypothetical protein
MKTKEHFKLIEGRIEGDISNPNTIKAFQKIGEEYKELIKIYSITITPDYAEITGFKTNEDGNIISKRHFNLKQFKLKTFIYFLKYSSVIDVIKLLGYEKIPETYCYKIKY